MSSNYKECSKCNGSGEVNNVSGTRFAPGTYRHYEEKQYDDREGGYYSTDK